MAEAHISAGVTAPTPPGLALPPLLLAIPAAGLVVGFTVKLFGAPLWSGWIWSACALPILFALVAEIGTALRRGEVGLDIVAALSMTAALAVGEALAPDEVVRIAASLDQASQHVIGQAIVAEAHKRR